MLTSREKIPSTGKKFSSEEDRTHDAASRRIASTTHYQRLIPSQVKLAGEENSIGPRTEEKILGFIRGKAARISRLPTYTFT